MAPYSMDLRTRVLADCDAGVAAKEVAAKFRVSRSWVNRLLQRTGVRVRGLRYVVPNRDRLSSRAFDGSGSVEAAFSYASIRHRQRSDSSR